MVYLERERGDPRNTLGVIFNRDEDKDQCKIAVKARILKGFYSRNQFDLCSFTETDVNQENSVPMCTAVITESSSAGQGFTKCNCAGKNKCQIIRYKCLERSQCVIILGVMEV